MSVIPLLFDEYCFSILKISDIHFLNLLKDWIPLTNTYHSWLAHSQNFIAFHHTLLILGILNMFYQLICCYFRNECLFSLSLSPFYQLTWPSPFLCELFSLLPFSFYWSHNIWSSIFLIKLLYVLVKPLIICRVYYDQIEEVSR